MLRIITDSLLIAVLQQPKSWAGQKECRAPEQDRRRDGAHRRGWLRRMGLKD